MLQVEHECLDKPLRPGHICRLVTDMKRNSKMVSLLRSRVPGQIVMTANSAAKFHSMELYTFECHDTPTECIIKFDYVRRFQGVLFSPLICV
jgi:hypothetical protein